MSFITLKDKIRSVLSGISDIQQVSDYPTQDFQGYPAVEIRTMGNTSDYETTTENDELYVFRLVAFQMVDDGINGPAKARDILEELCDTIRDTFDTDEFLDGISLPSDRTMIGIRPTLSTIDEVDNGKMVIADIELAIRVSKRIS